MQYNQWKKNPNKQYNQWIWQYNRWKYSTGDNAVQNVQYNTQKYFRHSPRLHTVSIKYFVTWSVSKTSAYCLDREITQYQWWRKKPKKHSINFSITDYQTQLLNKGLVNTWNENYPCKLLSVLLRRHFQKVNKMEVISNIICCPLGFLLYLLVDRSAVSPKFRRSFSSTKYTSLGAHFPPKNFSETAPISLKLRSSFCRPNYTSFIDNSPSKLFNEIVP